MFYVLIPLATLLAGGVTPAVSLCPLQLIPIICQSLAQPPPVPAVRVAVSNCLMLEYCRTTTFLCSKKTQKAAIDRKS